VASDEVVARTESPAAASVSEDYHSECLCRKAEDSFEGERPTGESYCLFIHCRRPGPHPSFFHLPIPDEERGAYDHSLIDLPYKATQQV
jgi:hypothetical protein